MPPDGGNLWPLIRRQAIYIYIYTYIYIYIYIFICINIDIYIYIGEHTTTPCNIDHIKKEHFEQEDPGRGHITLGGLAIPSVVAFAIGVVAVTSAVPLDSETAWKDHYGIKR